MSRPVKSAPGTAFGGSKKGWIILSVMLWLYFAISHIPAVWGAYLMTRSGNIAISGASGTIWAGRASLASVKVKGVDHSLGLLIWKLEPWSFFTLKPCALLTTQMDNQQFDGRVCVGRNSALSVYDANTNFPSVLLQPMLPLPVDGQFSLHIDELHMQNNQLAKLNGRFGWQEAKIFNGANWMSLGGFGADLTDDQKMGVNAHVFDVNSPVHLDLKVNLKAPAGGAVKGTLSMTEAFFKEANAAAWLSMFAAQLPTNAQGELVYSVDMNL